MMRCNICSDSKRVRLAIRRELTCAEERGDSAVSVPQAQFKEFDCPQCVPMVPYRRVRAMKVTTAYPADEFGKYQMPIERGLAARFGEYLLREGLIRFTQAGSKDFGRMADKITVTAHLGVVSREDTLTAGALPEVATTKPPQLPRRLTEREKRKLRIGVDREVVAWEPKPGPWPEPDEPVTDEFDEPKDALSNRFSGLEL